MQAVLAIINRECMNLYRACALLDCLRVAAMHHGYEKEVEAGDVAYVARGLVGDVLNALDRAELQKAAKIARGELAASRVTSCDSSNDMSPELRESIARGLADADAGRLVSVEDLMKEFGIGE